MIIAKTPLKEILELGKACSQKNNCCKHGSGFLVGDDIKKIAKKLKISVEEVKKNYLDEKEMFNKKLLRPKIKGNKQYGECIFFSDGCKIHEIKPLQCKIGNCGEHGEELSAWFLFNHIINRDDPESIRQYATYIKSGGKVIPGAELKDLVTDKDKLKKILSFEILH